MLATDVGAVKGKDKAEWTLNTHISRQLEKQQAGREEDTLNACAIW